MSAPKVYSLFNRPPSVGVRCELPSRTFQHLKADCSLPDMLVRLQRGDLTGIRRSISADVSDFPDDFQKVANMRLSAERIWNELPDSVRAAYGTPDKLLEGYAAFEELKARADKAAKADKSPPDGGKDSTSAVQASNT